MKTLKMMIKRRFLILIFSVCASLLPQKLAARELALLSYNIRCDYQKEGANTWQSRKKDMVEQICYYAPQVIGMQEVLPNQLDYLDSCLTNYHYVGVGRDDGHRGGEFCAIFYDTTQLRVLYDVTFWLSPTPDTVSIGWDAAYPRICTCGLFEDRKSKEQFWVFNTHLDHVGIKAREEASRLILQRIGQMDAGKKPLVLMGDFNATLEERSIQLLRAKLADAQRMTEKPFYGPVGTFNGFESNPIERRIDYFFVSHLRVKSYTHVDDRRNNQSFISDHWPVLITVEF